MNILVACEFSGVVRDAFRSLGHNAISCDLLDTERPGPHLKGFVEEYLNRNWDMVLAFPPCTYLCSSGLHWNKRIPDRARKTEEALQFVEMLMENEVPKIAIENPVGCISTRIRKPDQIIQPWQFGEDASKATCLWLKGLPKLVPTNVLSGGRRARRANQTPSGQSKLGPSPERAAIRSRTYPGIAHAMALQWGATT